MSDLLTLKSAEYTAPSDRDMQISKTVVSQIQAMTLLGCGYYGSMSCGDQVTVLKFRLARAYGHREIVVRLNGADLYDVVVYRFGRNFAKILVSEHSDIYCDQLDQIVYDGIAKSCER